MAALLPFFQLPVPVDHVFDSRQAGKKRGYQDAGNEYDPLYFAQNDYYDGGLEECCRFSGQSDLDMDGSYDEVNKERACNEHDVAADNQNNEPDRQVEMGVAD